MSKTLIGLLFIAAGIIYGCFAIDGFYNITLGWLVNNRWIKQPPAAEKSDLKNILGRKPTILVYAGILIIIGLFILWNKNS